MRRAFREAYNYELGLLRERVAEFAADYPGIADRLGGLIDDNLDPAIAGLLEGSAFLAARVQLNIEEQFRTFTEEMLEQILPESLQPIPSAMLVQANVPHATGGLLEGVHVDGGEYIDARFVDADKRVACRYRLAAPLTFWPVRLSALTYHASPAPIGAMGQDVAAGTRAGFSFDLATHDAAGQKEDAPPFALMPMDELRLHLTGALPLATALYEQIHCDRLRIRLRWLDKKGDPVFATLPKTAVQQIGFDEDERLFFSEARAFSGFALLREAFVFPRKFLGLKLTGLLPFLKRIDTTELKVILEFGTANAALAASGEDNYLRLNCAPAVNLFEDSSSQVSLDRKRHEFIVTPDSSPSTNYEVIRISEVFALYSAHKNKVPVHQLYTLPPEGQDPHHTLYYTAHRKPRRLTAQERRFGGARFEYRGTETFIRLYEPPGAEQAQRLQVKLLCSNRHLPEYLPIAQGTNDFYLNEDQTITFACIAGPTPPRPSLVDSDAAAHHRAWAGDNYWRLVSYLSLSQLGLENGSGGDAAAALREMLSLFANVSSAITAANISGLIKVETRPVTRTVARTDGYHPARGIEVSLTFDEDEFESSGIMLLGAVLDRFLAEYTAINSFTQCVIKSRQRGEVMTWPPRTGGGPLL